MGVPGNGVGGGSVEGGVLLTRVAVGVGDSSVFVGVGVSLGGRIVPVVVALGVNVDVSVG